jgi:hypothetical protein
LRFRHDENVLKSNVGNRMDRGTTQEKPSKTRPTRSQDNGKQIVRKRLTKGWVGTGLWLYGAGVNGTRCFDGCTTCCTTMTSEATMTADRGTVGPAKHMNNIQCRD